MIPGGEAIIIEYIVFDVNGTLALDGTLLPEVSSLLMELSERTNIHLLTADTHGKQAEIDQQLGMTATRVKAGKEAQKKLHSRKTSDLINQLQLDREQMIP